MIESIEQLIGRTIAGYQLQQLIGQGGMSAVFLADREGDDTAVAIKITVVSWLSNITQREAYRRRFQREMRALARLRHPHILPLLDAGETEGLMYLILPYIAGGSLASQLRLRSVPLPLPEVSVLLRQLADALDYAHDQGVIHRDLKPANILVGPDNGLLLTDFGILRLFGGEQATTITATGEAIGTPAYMAPEQAQGKSVSAAADIYSLGIIAYELVTGMPPFQGESSFAVLQAQVNDTPRDPCLLRPELPPRAGAAICRALAKEPRARWPNARAFITSFTQDIADEPDNSTPFATLAPAPGEVAPLPHTPTQLRTANQSTTPAFLPLPRTIPWQRVRKVGAIALALAVVLVWIMVIHSVPARPPMATNARSLPTGTVLTTVAATPSVTAQTTIPPTPQSTASVAPVLVFPVPPPCDQQPQFSNEDGTERCLGDALHVTKPVNFTLASWALYPLVSSVSLPRAFTAALDVANLSAGACFLFAIKDTQTTNESYAGQVCQNGHWQLEQLPTAKVLANGDLTPRSAFALTLTSANNAKSLAIDGVTVAYVPNAPLAASRVNISLIGPAAVTVSADLRRFVLTPLA